MARHRVGHPGHVARSDDMMTRRNARLKETVSGTLRGTMCRMCAEGKLNLPVAVVDAMLHHLQHVRAAAAVSHLMLELVEVW